jgi:TatD DNase family protein
VPPFFDSHAHLADPAFAGEPSAVAARARDAGATGILCVGESLAAAGRAAAVAAADPGFVWYSAGVHPHDAAVVRGRARPRRDPRARRAGAVAVGECGLDYHYDHAPRDRQRLAFAAQLELAASSRFRSSCTPAMPRTTRTRS